MKTPICPRWLRILAPAGVFAASTGLGVLSMPAARAAAPTLGVLEHELALAAEAREPASVREIARRILAVDATPERQLRLAETFLALRLYGELEEALAAAVRASPVRPRVVDKFRAQAAAARGEWGLAASYWDEFLAAPAGLPPEQRSAALDELVQALLHQHAWQRARARLDERLALADGPAPRVQRATVLARMRRWDAAAEDFSYLRRMAPDDARVKPLLPRWERVERALPELTAGDAALNTAPTALTPRLERALVSLQTGLWQNAVEDLAVAARDWPMTRMSSLLLSSLTHRRDYAGEQDMVSRTVPVFAPSDELIKRQEQYDDERIAWQALRACDAEIAAATDRAPIPALLAEQARWVCALGHPQRALEDARGVLRQAPHFLPADCVEITALMALRRWLEADAAVTAALRHHEDAADTELGRLAGLVWQAQGKHQAAIDVFTSYLAAHRTPDVLRARARSLRFLQRFTDASDDLLAADILEAAVAVRKP